MRAMLRTLLAFPQAVRFGILLETNNHEKLQASAERRLSRKPGDAVARFYLMHLLVQKGLLEQACECLVDGLRSGLVLPDRHRVKWIYRTVNEMLRKRQYEAAYRCSASISEYLGSGKAGELLLRARCISLFQLSRFTEVRRTLASLEGNYGEDLAVREFVNSYRIMLSET